MKERGHECGGWEGDWNGLATKTAVDAEEQMSLETERESLAEALCLLCNLLLEMQIPSMEFGERGKIGYSGTSTDHRRPSFRGSSL